MSDFCLSLDLIGALALFRTLETRTDNPPEIERLEGALRAFLYERLSIEEMEDPGRLYLRLVAERDRQGRRP
jgi:hypothetical protein